jgi:predicted nucleotidyltransferase
MAGYQQPWQQPHYGQQQGYYQGQQYSQQQYQYANNLQHQQQMQQAMSGQRHFNTSRLQRLPDQQQQLPDQQQQNGYRQQQQQQPQQQQQQMYGQLGSTPNSRPAKRMRGDGSGQPQQQQQQGGQQHRHRQQQLTQEQRTAQPRQNAAGQQLPSSNHPDPAAAAWLDSLQEHIAAFVERVVPNAQEQQHRDACMAAFTRITADSLPEHARAMQVALFGSGAAGLSLHSSDLDVVLTGRGGVRLHVCLQDMLAGHALSTLEGRLHSMPVRRALYDLVVETACRTGCLQGAWMLTVSCCHATR